MGISGESQIGLGHGGLGVRRATSMGVQRHAKRANFVVDPREAACYAVAMLAIAGALTANLLNATRSRDAVAAADAEAAESAAQQKAAEDAVAAAVRTGAAIQFAAGISEINYDGGTACVIDPAISEGYLILLTLIEPGDPNSLVVSAVGLAGQIDQQAHPIVAAPVAWDQERGAFTADGGPYDGQAVGAGMLADPADHC